MGGSVAKIQLFGRKLLPKGSILGTILATKMVPNRCNKSMLNKLMMMPKLIQNGSQKMNPKPMQHECIFWEDDFVKNIFSAMISIVFEDRGFEHIVK